MATPEYVTANFLSQWMGLKPDEARTIDTNAMSHQPYIDMGTNIVYYSVGDTIRIFDDTTPIGEELVVESLDGTIITCTTDLVNTYSRANHAKVQNLSHFTPRSIPTKAFLEEIMVMNEAVLDRDIHTSYRQAGIKITQWGTAIIRGSVNYPYLSMPLRYPFDMQNPVQLSHLGMCPFDPVEGDSFFFMWGSEWKDLLDKDNGYRVWEAYIETLVNAYSMAGTAPITATLTRQPRLNTPLFWSLTHSNITAFSLEIIGVDHSGTARTETFTQANGWSGYTTYFYKTITSIKLNSRTGTGVGDTLTVTTKKDQSRMSSDYDAWVDYEHGMVYPKSLTINDGQKAAYVTYHYSHYYMSDKTVPQDIKKAALLLTAIDVLSNERYAINLPGGGVGDQTKVEIQINSWKAEYKQLVTKRRESPAISRYE